MTRVHIGQATVSDEVSTTDRYSIISATMPARPTVQRSPIPIHPANDLAVLGSGSAAKAGGREVRRLAAWAAS